MHPKGLIGGDFTDTFFTGNAPEGIAGRANERREYSTLDMRVVFTAQS